MLDRPGEPSLHKALLARKQMRHKLPDSIPLWWDTGKLVGAELYACKLCSGDDLNTEDRVSTECEEVIMNANLFQPQQPHFSC